MGQISAATSPQTGSLLSGIQHHAYFLGGKDPFEKLKTALKAEVDEDVYSDNQDAMSATIRMRLRGWILG
ncbi:MAG: hypothetical protein ING16_15860 [Roseomonas sp.]|nr:hypothetical protein [Roseomonas sp.]